MRLASTQRYRNDAIVAEKREQKRYDVHVVRLEVGGEEMAYIIDGHHRLEAAIEAGVEPEIITDIEQQHDADKMGHAEYLNANHGGDDPYWIEDGSYIF